MFANYRTRQEFTDEQKELIELFANQAAIAIQNARLYKDLDEQVKERTKQKDDINHRLETLIYFGQILTSGIRLKEDEILNLIHKQASELMDTDNMYIALYDEKPDDTIRFGLAYQDGKPTPIKSRKIDDAKRGRTEEIIRTKQSIFTPTRDESVEWYQQPGRAEFIGNPLSSWIGVPMMVEDKVLGVVATYHPTDDNVYSEGDMRILQSMANIAAVAIENARRYGELEDANTKIAQKEAILVRTMIASDFVHRLNNLAGTIPAWVDLVREGLTQTPIPLNEISDYLDKIWRDSDDLLRAAEQLNDMPRRQQVDVAFVLQSMLRQIRIQYRKSIAVSETIQPELYKVSAIPFALTSALSSVVSNGVDAMMEVGGGTLIVDARNEQDQIGQEGIRIEVRDTGEGIADDFIDKLFVPFLSTKGEGRGYGLWRAKTVIEELGGSIQVDTAQEQGTTFTLWLPKSIQEESNVTE
jgi:signal transduction histidine kinase